MDETTKPGQPRLTRREISAAVGGLGWRLILGTVQTFVLVPSLAEAARVVASLAGTVAGAEAAQSLRADVRGDRVVLTLQSPVTGWVTSRELDLAGQISALMTGVGLTTSADDAAAGRPVTRSVQGLEIAIDALDIPAVRPFWQAVLGYVDEPGQDGPPSGLVDPAGQGPAVWFQQMDAPRPQRNRIHFDVSVPAEEAAGRIAVALAAGGRLLSDAEAPAFWVLADPEGNEACVCTWQGRDT